MTFEPGDLVIVPFPYTDLTATKRRPAVVVSTAAFNATGTDIILCGISSSLTAGGQGVLIQPRDLAEGFLPATSRVKVGKIQTLDRSVVRKRIGRLKPAVLAQVWKELHALLP